MKLSAKITTATFLAAMALGAAALTGGCTVTSTTSNDTDGGTSSSSSGGSSSGGSSSGSTSDSGTDDGGTAACADNTKQTFKFPDTCQTCLEQKCCDKLVACFGQDPGDAGDVDCNVYAQCISDCNAKPEAEQQDCYDACDAATNQSILTAYDILSTQCAATNCATECQ